MDYKKRKYLNDIGVVLASTEDMKNSKGEEKFREQRELYGFDERDTWSLDFTMRALLYERLKMYFDIADQVINLNHHTITYKNIEYTQRELILELIYLLEDVIKKEDESYFYDEQDKLEFYDSCNEVWQIWALLEPAMWW